MQSLLYIIYNPRKSIFLIFLNVMPDEAKRRQAVARQRGKGLAGLRFSAVAYNQQFHLWNGQYPERNRQDGGFRKRRTGCPLLPARPVEYHISISLVKSDWKLQQKTAPPRQPPFRSPRLHFILSARALIKIDFRGLPAFSTAPYKKFHNFLLLRSQYRCLP